MRTTIAVAVTIKVDVEANDVDTLIRYAVERAMEMAEAGTHQFFTHATVEGATALVNREALDRLTDA